MKHILPALLLLAALPALADTAAPPAKKSAKKKSSAVDFGTMTLPDLPKGDGMAATQANAPDETTRAPATPGTAHYALVAVSHAQQFVTRGEGHEARHPIKRIDVVNLPTVIPAFQTLVRVKSVEKLGATIAVRLLDPQGAQLVASEGALVFGSHEEAEFLVDWDPFRLQKPGSYQVDVMVGGQSIGKASLPVSQQLSAHLTATVVDAGSAPPPPETWP
jgi:hypothetical protein